MSVVAGGAYQALHCGSGRWPAGEGLTLSEQTQSYTLELIYHKCGLCGRVRHSDHLEDGSKGGGVSSAAA